jgi:hypothetical protein
VGTLWRAAGREVTAAFAGRSMEPTIAPGDLVSLHCGGEAAAGDVVAYLRGDTLVLHRLEAVDRRGRWWLLRGDANLVPDHLVTDQGRLVARVVSVRAGEGEPHAPGPAPGGLARSLVLGLARLALALSPVLGRRAVSALRLVRGRPRTAGDA